MSSGLFPVGSGQFILGGMLKKEKAEAIKLA
jgi:hypothetical protein